MFTGKSSRSFRDVPFKVEMSSLTRHSLLTWIFSVNACLIKDMPLQFAVNFCSLLPVIP